MAGQLPPELQNWLEIVNPSLTGCTNDYTCTCCRSQQGSVILPRKEFTFNIFRGFPLSYRNEVVLLLCSAGSQLCS